MCARAGIIANIEEIREYFLTTNTIHFEKTYNLAPSQQTIIIDEQRACRISKWGLLPHWAKPDTKPQINARSETIHEKPFFKKAFETQRCVVPISFWFEWVDTKEGKQPYCFKRVDGSIMGVAGVYNGHTFAMITKEADSQCQQIHSRMPVLLSSSHYDYWLSDAKIDSSDLRDLFFFNNHVDLSIFKVTKNMNKPSYNKSDIIEPI